VRFPVVVVVVVVVLLMALLLMLLGSFLANDAAASFARNGDSHRQRSGVKFPERAALGPSKKFWRVRP